MKLLIVENANDKNLLQDLVNHYVIFCVFCDKLLKKVVSSS